MVATALAIGGALVGCPRRPAGVTPEGPTANNNGREGSGDGAREDGQQRTAASRRPPAGATCDGREDCASDQLCVESRCEYRQTSVAGEVLAAAAEAQVEAGDWNGAIESYDQAFDAFARHDAPVPPQVACAAAALMLRTATDRDTRERAAQRADLCFRTSVPGDPRRTDVRRALARLRFEGLELAAFDHDEPANRFFTQEASRPTLDAVQIAIEMPDLEPANRGHDQTRELLNGDNGTRAIAECFIQDWELHHGRSAEANLGLRYSTRLREFDSYDEYLPVFEVQQQVQGEDGFEPCLARGLRTLFEADGRNIRGSPWNQAIRIVAHLQ